MVVTLFYLIVFCLSVILFSWRREFAMRLVVFGICLLGIYEAVLGISQIFGHSVSNHSLFALTGTLSNPGPYGGLMAVVFAVTFAQSLRESRQVLPALCAIASFLVLPASMSRAGWLAAGAAVIVWAFYEKNLYTWLKQHRLLAILSSSALAAFFVGIFFLYDEIEVEI